MTSILHFSKYLANVFPVICLFVIICLSVCFHLAKIDQAGGPETFF